jgi:hypothetical protein
MSKSLHWKELPDNLKDRIIEQGAVMITGTPNMDKVNKAMKEITAKKPKYNSKKAEVDGIVFDSKKEANFYQELLMLQRAGEVINIERQVKYPYFATYARNNMEFDDITYTKPGFYKADFVVTYKDGHKDVIDIKGFRTLEFRRKKKIVEAIYGITIIEK